jgi:parallel beta-helix repeat protein
LHVFGAAIVAVIAMASTTHARVTIVPDDFPTLQAAADALHEGAFADTLLVRGGTYPEIVVFRRGIRVEAIPSVDGSDLIPRIQGLQVSGGHGERYLFIGLHFTGHVQHGVFAGISRVHFIGCRFDGGMSPGGIPGTLTTIQLTRCALYQSVLIDADEGVMDSCNVRGSVVMTTPYRAFVADNTFEIAGTAFFARTRNAVVARNRVRGGEQAFVLQPDDNLDAHVVDNDIEGCRGFAIQVNAGDGPIRLERNRIARCGGFGAQLRGHIQARDNRITDCRGAGLDLYRWMDPDGIVEGNVIARCDLGIRVGSDPWNYPTHFTVRANTIYGCNGPGIAISDAPGCTITNNIVYACLGLTASGSDPLQVSCNDWFQVLGASGSTSDLSVDPQFCDLAADDVRLRSDSPLLDVAGCGRIGALGQGCEAPIVALGVELSPRVLQPTARARWVTAWLEPPAPFTVAKIDLASVRVNGVAVAPAAEASVGDHDRDALPDLQLRFERTAFERVLTESEEQSVTITGRIGNRNFSGSDAIRRLRPRGGPRSAVPRPAVLAIQAGGPGGVVAFTLVDGSPARVEMVDVAGRVVRSHEVGSRGPGEHSFDLAAEGLAQGIYFLRLRQGASEARTKVVVVR